MLPGTEVVEWGRPIAATKKGHLGWAFNLSLRWQALQRKTANQTSAFLNSPLTTTACKYSVTPLGESVCVTPSTASSITRKTDALTTPI